MMTSTWRLWLNRFSRHVAGAQRGQRRVWAVRPRLELHLERLEDRTVPSVFIAPPNNNGNGYTGLDFNQSGGYVPPDTCGAAGPASYVETVNQSVALYRPSIDGGTTVTNSLSNFWFTQGGLAHTDSGSGLSDPIVTYDDQAQRFIIGDQDVNFTTHLSNFDIAVSKTSTPKTLTSADWNFYQINTTESGFDADYPGNFGYNHDAFVFTLNMFPASTGSFHTQIDSVNAADLASGVSQANLHSYRNDNYSSASLRPTTMHDSVAGDPMWLIQETGDGAHIDVFKMTNVLSNSASFAITTLAVNPYSDIGNTPPLNPNGAAITTNIDSRIQKAAEYNHTIVAAHAVSVGAAEDDAQWYKIDVSSGTPVLSDQGRVSFGNNTYVFYPAIDINASGQIGMTFMKSGTDSSTDYMSTYVTGRLSTDAAGTMETPVIVPAGTGQANYTDFASTHRAGDLSGISLDPNNGSFWAANEFANTEATANWGTAIVNFWPGIRFGSLVQVTDVTPFTNTSDVTAQPGSTVWLNSEVEPRLAVDPNNSLHMIGGWQQDRWSDGGARGLVIGVTTDGGNTWTKVPLPDLTVNTGGNYLRASDVWTSIGPDGIAYAAILAVTDNVDGINNAMMVSRSTDGGFTWSNPIVITTSNNGNLFNDKESITADPTKPGYAYMVWDRLNSGVIAGQGPGPAMISRTTDGGLTWSAPTPIYDPSDGQTIANQLVVLPNGTLLDMGVHLPNAGGSNIFAITSTDKGLTWSAPVNVSTFSSTGESDPNTGTGIRGGDIIPDIAVDHHTGNIYIVWEDGRFSSNAHDDIALSESTDGGQTWSTPIKVNQTPVNASKPADEQAFTPTIAVAADGTIAVSYYDFRNNTGTGGALTDRWIVFANPNQAGPLTFGNERRVTTSSFNIELAPNAYGLFVGDYEGLVAGGSSPDTFGVFYSATVSTQDPASVFFRGEIQSRNNLALTSFAPPTGAVEGTAVGGTLASFTDSAANSVLSAFTATVTWGDGTTDILTAANGGIVANIDGSFSVIDTHTYTEESSGETFSLLITDGGGFDTAPSAYIHVADAPLTSGVLTAPGAAEGQALSNVKIFHFRDTDPGATASDYTAVVTLGDGNTVTLTSTASANGQIVASPTSGFDVYLSYTYAEEFSNQTFGVTVTDHNSAISASISTFSVVDRALTSGILTTPTATEGQPLSNVTVYNFTDSDPAGTASDYTAVVTLGDGNTLTLTSTPSTNGQIVAHGNGTFDVQLSYTYAEELSGATFSVTVSDSPSTSLSTTITSFSVADAALNAGAFTPPVATANVPFSNVVVFHFTDSDPAGVVTDYTAVVNEGDGTTVTLTSTPSANGQIVANGGGFDVQLSHTYTTGLSNATFSVTVTDHVASASASTNTFSVTSSSLSTGPLTPPVATEGAGFSNVTIVHFSDTHTGTTASNYTAVVTLGDGNSVTLTGTASAQGQIVSNAGGGFDVQLSYTYAEELSGQTFSVLVTSLNTGDQTFTSTNSFSVADASLTAGALTPPVATEGQALSNVMVFHFSDADPAGAASDYKAVLTLGDGSTVTLTSTASANGQIVASPASGFDVQLSHTYAEELSNKTFSVTVTDAGGASTSASTTTFSVADAGLNASTLTAPAATEGVALNNATVLHFTDNDPAGTASDYTAVVTTGDGSTVTLTSTASANGRIVANVSGGFDVQLSHTYLEEATGLTLSVRVTDAGGAGTGTLSTNFNVTDAALTAGALTPPVTTVNTPFSNVKVFHFTDADTGGVVTDYTAVVNEGDGTTVTLTSTPSANGQIVANGGGFDVQLSHTYTAPLNNATFSVSVTDAGGASTSASTTFSVGTSTGLTPGALTPPPATEGVAFSNVTVFRFSDGTPNPLSAYTAVVTRGDGTSVTLTGTASANGQIVADPSGGFDVQLSYTYAEELANQTFTVRVSRTGASTSATTSSFAVADAIPVLNPLTVSGGIVPGQGVSLSGTFSDTGTLDSHTATIDWGDGYTGPGTISGSNGSGTVTGNHTYAVFGSYTISVTVLDDEGTKSNVQQAVVNAARSIILLDSAASGALTVSNAAVINIPGSITVDSNSPTALQVLGTAQVTAAAINVHGGYSASPGATISPTPTTGAAIVADPIGSRGKLATPGGPTVTVGGTQTLTINPGNYEGITVNGSGHLIMNPGMYLVSGPINLSQNALVTGSGVTIVGPTGFITPDGGGSAGTYLSMALSGNAQMIVSASTSGSWTGIFIYESNPDKNALQIADNAVLQTTGTIYLQGAKVVLSGTNPTLQATVVADAMTVSGGSHVTMASMSAASSPPTSAVSTQQPSTATRGTAGSVAPRALTSYQISVRQGSPAQSPGSSAVTVMAAAPTSALLLPSTALLSALMPSGAVLAVAPSAEGRVLAPGSNSAAVTLGSDGSTVGKLLGKAVEGTSSLSQREDSGAEHAIPWEGLLADGAASNPDRQLALDVVFSDLAEQDSPMLQEPALVWLLEEASAVQENA